MDGKWIELLDRGVTAIIAVYVIVRLEPRFSELRDVVIGMREAITELTDTLKHMNGGA